LQILPQSGCQKKFTNILIIRILYPDSSLADQYDPITMPPQLLKAHQNFDRVVMGFYTIYHDFRY